MSDRELLEMAAKAHGEIHWDGEDPASMGCRRDGRAYWWSPLTDDGDALRLAVKLNLSIITSWGFNGEPSGCVGTILGSHDDLRITSTTHGNDPCAAWRRSIVLAAAEIGRHMP